MRRAVITGLGIVSCLGNDRESVTKSLREGISGIRRREDFVEMASETAVVMLDSGVDDAVSSLETTAGVDIDFFPWLAVDLLLELRRFTFGRCAATQVLNFPISVATSLSMILPPFGVTGAWRSDTTGFTVRPSRLKFISLSGNPVNPYLSRAVRASLSHILAAPTSVLAWNPILDFAS